MKKAILTIALLSVTTSAFAYLQEYTTSDIKTWQGKGYSQSALEIVDNARMMTQGVEKDYVPFYKRKLYSDVPIVKWYQIAKRYFDPAASEDILGFREINYQNAWFPASPSYSERVEPNDKYTRLYEDDIKRLDRAGKIIKGSKGFEAPEDSGYEPEVDEIESL